jgi:drug/metabolite transporter (DMT)-like permease
MPGRFSHLRAPVASVALALGVVYLVWGSTYLGIKIAGDTMPPLLMLGARFLVAGAILYPLTVRRLPPPERPTARQWRDATVVAAGLLLGGLGLVGLAERTVPTGIAALLIAAAPLWLTLFDRIAFGVRLSGTILAGLVVGFSGVALLVTPGVENRFDAGGVAMMLVSPVLWSAGTMYAKRADLPSRPFVATSLEMLVGGVLLVLAGTALGEWRDLHLDAISARSLVAFAYLVVVGSLIAFTAYVWLLTVAPISLISTYAYVNPVVALALGALIESEPVTSHTLVAAIVTLGGVALIVTSHARSPASASP